MKLNNIDEAEKLMKTIRSCKGDIYLTDERLDNDGKYNFYLNLKSILSLYFGVSKLLSKDGDLFKLHVCNYEDEVKINDLISELNNERKENI